LSHSVTAETLAAVRDNILGAFGVLPAMLNSAATGPVIREGERHLASWVLQPIAALVAEEATAKFGQQVTIDTPRPLQAFDAGGRARAFNAVITSLAEAKAAGLEADQVTKALSLVAWADDVERGRCEAGRLSKDSAGLVRGAHRRAFRSWLKLLSSRSFSSWVALWALARMTELPARSEGASSPLT
jgi:hypothetical protein